MSAGGPSGRTDAAEQDLTALYDLHVQAARAQTRHVLQVSWRDRGQALSWSQGYLTDGTLGMWAQVFRAWWPLRGAGHDHRASLLQPAGWHLARLHQLGHTEPGAQAPE